MKDDNKLEILKATVANLTIICNSQKKDADTMKEDIHNLQLRRAEDKGFIKGVGLLGGVATFFAALAAIFTFLYNVKP